MIDNIDIDLDDIDEYLNDYDDDKIDDDLVEYIMNSIDDFDKNVVFNVNFKYKDYENKIDKFKNRLDITFKELNDKNDICIKKINYRIFIMFILGMLLIGVSNILKSFELLTFSEVIKVLYWFSFTYVCEEIIYARRKLIKIKKKYDKIFNAKINVKSK
jgi:hypothetical protein